MLNKKKRDLRTTKWIKKKKKKNTVGTVPKSYRNRRQRQNGYP